jgi:hypothetical protein
MGTCSSSEVITLRQLSDTCNNNTAMLITLVYKYYKSGKFGGEEMKVIRLLLSDSPKDFSANVEIYLLISEIFNDLNLYHLIVSFSKSIRYTLEIPNDRYPQIMVALHSDTQEPLKVMTLYGINGDLSFPKILSTDFPNRFS